VIGGAFSKLGLISVRPVPQKFLLLPFLYFRNSFFSISGFTGSPEFAFLRKYFPATFETASKTKLRSLDILGYTTDESWFDSLQG
jgi:hypothetical protein